MSEEKPTMSMCKNLTDYHQETIKWQRSKIEQLEGHIKELKAKIAIPALQLIQEISEGEHEGHELSAASEFLEYRADEIIELGVNDE